MDIVNNTFYKDGGFIDKRHISPEALAKMPDGFLPFLKIKCAQERDVCILSSIVALSSCLPNVVSAFYKRDIAPHHYLYVAGPPSSGKGAVCIAERITKKVDKAIYEQYKRDLAAYKSSLREKESDDLEKPLKNKLYIPPNSTDASFVRSLVAQDQTGSLLVAAETSTLLSANQKTHGGFTDKLLNCFEHETIQKDLVGEDFILSKEEPKLSMVLASNLKDFRSFLDDASASGLLSRILIYTTSEKKDVVLYRRPKFTQGELEEELKEDCKGLYDFLKTRKRRVDLTEEQDVLFDEWMNTSTRELKRLNSAIGGDITRFTMSCYRQLMTLVIYRAFKDGRLEGKGVIYPTREDFDVFFEIAAVQGSHLLTAYDFLGQKPQSFASVYEVLKKMPEVFRSAAFIAILKANGMSQRSAERKLKDLFKTGYIAREGIYRGQWRKNTKKR